MKHIKNQLIAVLLGLSIISIFGVASSSTAEDAQEYNGRLLRSIKKARAQARDKAKAIIEADQLTPRSDVFERKHGQFIMLIDDATERPETEGWDVTISFMNAVGIAGVYEVLKRKLAIRKSL